eukprot:311711_1
MPRFASSLTNIFPSILKLRSKIIMILRTLSSIIIPILSSIVLLNDCGSLWSQLWIPCLNNNNENAFDIAVPVSSIPYTQYFGTEQTDYTYLHFDSLPLQILSEKEVCDTISIDDFTQRTMNRCIRSFLFEWCNVLMIKMIIMCFMPVFILCYKSIKRKLLKQQRSNQISIDSE